MTITEVQIVPVQPSGSLVAFASCIVDGWLYLGSIAVHKRLQGGYRLVYPTRNRPSGQARYYYPITRLAGADLERAIIPKYVELFGQPS